MYVSGVKILRYLAAGSKNGYCSGFAFKPQAKKQLRDLGHVSRFSFHRLRSVGNKAE